MFSDDLSGAKAFFEMHLATDEEMAEATLRGIKTHIWKEINGVGKPDCGADGNIHNSFWGYSVVAQSLDEV